MRRLVLVSIVGMLIVPWIVTARAQAPAACDRCGGRVHDAILPS